MFGGGDFKVLSMTEAGAARVREIADGKNARGIRIGIKNGGCAGMEYTIDLVTEPDAKDDRVEEHGAEVWVDPSASLFLLGHGTRLRGDQAALGLRVQQPEPDLGLRLRRVGDAGARGRPATSGLGLTERNRSKRGWFCDRAPRRRSLMRSRV